MILVEGGLMRKKKTPRIRMRFEIEKCVLPEMFQDISAPTE